jgi:hypothetical protein
VTGSERVYTYSLGEGCPHTHILAGPPHGDLRGKVFITALLGRDETLADQQATDRIAARLAGELSGRTPEITQSTSTPTGKR